MSFLLDALRKSENQKHRGQVPTIHSTDGMEFGQRQGVRPGLILLILLPAVLVIGWYSWQHFTRPGDQNTIPVQTIEPATTPLDPQAAEPPSGQAGTVTSLPEIPKHSVLNNPPRPERTAVENYSEPVTEIKFDESGGSPSFAAGQPGAPPGSAQDQQSPGKQASASEGFDRSNAATGPDRPAVVDFEPSMQAQQSEDRETHFSVITYWRLPESIREEIPLPRISVLVYAERPQDRFILMGGSRFVEGDETRPGMVLEKIRRDGAVFSYRLYHFLVAQ